MADTNGKTWKEKGLEWLLQQGPTTVLLSVILGVMFYQDNYERRVAEPARIAAIQAGYERMDAKHESALKAQWESHTAQLRYVMDSLREFRVRAGSE